MGEIEGLPTLTGRFSDLSSYGGFFDSIPVKAIIDMGKNRTETMMSF